VLATTFGSTRAHPRLHVLDSTDPGAVLRLERGVPWAAAAVVAASKSGTTIETRSHLARFTERLRDVHGDEAQRWLIAITDPGSELDAFAVDTGFRAVVHGQPDVGGRYSALTPFGLLPAALLGVDLEDHLAPAAAVLDATASTDPEINTGAVLGAAMAVAARRGRDKLTLVLPEEIAAFGGWVEQLVAESTGKDGIGIVPVIDETTSTSAAGCGLGDLVGRIGEDRLVVAFGDHEGAEELAAAGTPVVQLPWDGPQQLSAEVARFEVATAVAGALLGVNPFDQPDVQAAKVATGELLRDGANGLPATGSPSEVLTSLAPGDYLALLGFVTPRGDDEAALHAAARRLRDRLRVPVTVGIGPRYLHSTGQLHKGGPPGGFLVVVGEDPEDADIPGADHTFSQLKRAQAAGDLRALRDAGRRVAHISPAEVRGLG
jgi:hypothetical protein